MIIILIHFIVHQYKWILGQWEIIIKIMLENRLIKPDIILLVRKNIFFISKKKRRKTPSFQWKKKSSSVGRKSFDKLTNKTSSLIMKIYNLRELGKLFERLKRIIYNDQVCYLVRIAYMFASNETSWCWFYFFFV